MKTTINLAYTYILWLLWSDPNNSHNAFCSFYSIQSHCLHGQNNVILMHLIYYLNIDIRTPIWNWNKFNLIVWCLYAFLFTLITLLQCFINANFRWLILSHYLIIIILIACYDTAFQTWLFSVSFAGAVLETTVHHRWSDTDRYLSRSFG